MVRVLRNKDEIALYNHGVSKTKEVVLIRKNGGREVLFHTFEWKRNSSFMFVNLTLSPDERFVTATAAENGTIDDYRVIVYDLVNRKTLTDDLSVTHK